MSTDLSDYLLDYAADHREADTDRRRAGCEWTLRYVCHQAQYGDQDDRDLAAKIWASLPDDARWPPLREP